MSMYERQCELQGELRQAQVEVRRAQTREATLRSELDTVESQVRLEHGTGLYLALQRDPNLVNVLAPNHDTSCISLTSSLDSSCTRCRLSAIQVGRRWDKSLDFTFTITKVL